MPIKRKSNVRRGRKSPRGIMSRRRNRCPFKKAGTKSVDYKNVRVLEKYINFDGKIASSRATGVSSLMQRKLAVAIKRARYLALLPYTDQHSIKKKSG